MLLPSVWWECQGKHCSCDSGDSVAREEGTGLTAIWGLECAVLKDLN